MSYTAEPSFDREPVTDREIKNEKDPARKAILRAIQRAVEGQPNIKKPVTSLRTLAEEAEVSTYPLGKKGKARDLYLRFEYLIAERDKLTTPTEISQAKQIEKLGADLLTKLEKIEKLNDRLLKELEKTKKIEKEKKDLEYQSGMLIVVLDEVTDEYEYLKRQMRRLEEQVAFYKGSSEASGSGGLSAVRDTRETGAGRDFLA